MAVKTSIWLRVLWAVTRGCWKPCTGISYILSRMVLDLNCIIRFSFKLFFGLPSPYSKTQFLLFSPFMHSYILLLLVILSIQWGRDQLVSVVNIMLIWLLIVAHDYAPDISIIMLYSCSLTYHAFLSLNYQSWSTYNNTSKMSWLSRKSNTAASSLQCGYNKQQ